MQERPNTENWYQAVGHCYKHTRYKHTVEVTLELGNMQSLEEFGGLKKDRKMKESLKHYLSHWGHLLTCKTLSHLCQGLVHVILNISFTLIFCQ